MKMPKPASCAQRLASMRFSMRNQGLWLFWPGDAFTASRKNIVSIKICFWPQKMCHWCCIKCQHDQAHNRAANLIWGTKVPSWSHPHWRPSTPCLLSIYYLGLCCPLQSCATWGSSLRCCWASLEPQEAQQPGIWTLAEPPLQKIPPAHATQTFELFCWTRQRPVVDSCCIFNTV